MNVPPKNGDRVRASPPRDAAPAEYWLIGAVSLVVTLVGGTWLYPAFVTMTSSLRFLSTTAIVFIYIFFWVGLWVSLELVWERQA